MGFPGAEIIYPVYVEVQARAQETGVGEFVSWQPQVSIITVIAVIGMMIGFGGWLFKIGGRNRDFDSVQTSVKEIRQEFKDLVAERDKAREVNRSERDAFNVAVNAGLQMSESRNSEFRASVSATYATKKELSSLEERTSKDMDRVVSRLDTISGRLEIISDNVVKALGSMAGR